ncbi:MAG TPA: calcium/sodium antiporter [Paludibacteraceae bacterium]|jgi:cation:H+ antiporter|nr:calcium/sodium antiporter [Paludibacteraceae bacterium]HPH62103.1 calcium/sodium antiporter [Paludibacteraceae bacterium]HQF49355.1 calcium/sodium antiporter [Paludibacteraceae bacterium]
MLLSILGLLGGLAIIVLGANKLVDGGSALAAHYNIPNIVIGLTIVAFGTSAPELIVSSMSAIEGQSALALGNVLGSNIFNILGIIGISAMIYPMNILKNTTTIEVPYAILCSLVILGTFFIGEQAIGIWEAVFFLVLFGVFNIYTTYVATHNQAEEVSIKTLSLWKSILFILIGFAGLFLGGKWLVNSAIEIATVMGISERIIAVTIISIGTSLPELATSVVAARKHQVEMAVGNVIGSNIFNTLLILGVCGLISPIEIATESLMDIYFNIFATLLLFLFIFTGKGRQIERWEGFLLIFIYVAYVVYLIVG